jgi:hypothetical protein
MNTRGMSQAARRRAGLGGIAALLALVAGLVALVVASGPASAKPTAVAGTSTSASSPSCNLGTGISHVINILVDHVHFARDNPNVPSDLEQMPNLLNFLKNNGTLFSNSHTPLIAHTANDSLAIYSGLYGDRHGQPLTNSFHTYNPNGSTDPNTSFTYWTSPIIDTKVRPAIPNPADTTPSMVYSDHVPATIGDAGNVTPAPWVPFTRAGCTVGDFSTANVVLENAAVDVPTAFGQGSAEAIQTASDPDSFKNLETADYVGEAIHCAKDDSICTSSTRPVSDVLGSEPGGYTGFQALFGHKYVAPQLGAGTASKTSHGFAVTNAAGNLVDLDGNEIDGGFLTPAHPGFPGFNPTATQSLALLADMQEAGIPVTYGYISDLHERKPNTTGCTTAGANTGFALGPGDKCFVDNAKAYDAAFGKFFDRLAADGITPANTLFVVSAEENDQLAGANVGRTLTPTPSSCNGVSLTGGTSTPCSYPAGTLGERQASIAALLTSENAASKNTQFDVEPQGAAIYVHGQPGPDDPVVRQLERDTAAMTADNPYTVANEKIVNYQAGALEQRVLHMQTPDPLRTPTYTIFPKGDYFFSGTNGAAEPPVTINSRFAWDHGYYSPNIDITWVGMAGPGVAKNGVDGPQPAQGNEANDPNATKTVPEASQVGTWVEEVDIRPTMLYLAGLTDDYQSDGHVITQALSSVPAALAATADLAKGYTQINSSVGQFATDTLIADTKALASGSAAGDGAYTSEQLQLKELADDRDAAATTIKKVLAASAAGQMPNHGQVVSGQAHVKELLARAQKLATS